MRAAKHWRSAGAFCIVAGTFVGTGLLLGGGEFGYRGFNDDPRSVLVEVIAVESDPSAGSDPAFNQIMDLAQPDGGARALSADEFERARELAGSLAAGAWHTPSLIAQHGETSRTTLARTGLSAETYECSVSPIVLKDGVIRVALTISETTGRATRSSDMTFTSSGGTAVATGHFGSGAAPGGSMVLLVRPTLVVVP